MRGSALRSVLIGAAVVLVVGALFWGGSHGHANQAGGPHSTTENVDLSALIGRVRSKPSSIDRVVFVPGSQQIQATLASGSQLNANYPTPQAQISFQQLLEKQKVDFASKAPPSSSSGWGATALAWVIPILLLVALWWFISRRAGSQGNQIMGFARSRAKQIGASTPTARYADVAGADEAIEELREIKEFLSNTGRFRALGARIPKGVLLHGPPGTGKTLLARATAGEAGVPFFSISGSDFVEMFVGVGASRVRDLFEKAKQAAPSIVFIDELDAVGRHRGAGVGGGNDEREQTLNQLLVAMDGFDANQNVVVVAATNRPDVLDPALLRPGRFDRQIIVDRPDRAGRRQILAVHARGKPLDDDVDLDRLAATTPGFTGADLSNLLNEAALLTGRRSKMRIGQSELEEAMMRVVAGPEKRTRVLSERERTVAAYHEVGHALVGEFLEHADRPRKVSIIGRGRALGYTLSVPAEDKMLTVRSELMANLAMTLGGRTAEELVFDEVSTGAMNDLEKVTSTATAMVTRYGMSEAIGPRVLSQGDDQPFMGRQLQGGSEHSEELTRKIDHEVRRILEEAHDQARRVLCEHEADLHRISHVLADQETIDRDELDRLLGVDGDGGAAAPPGDESEPAPAAGTGTSGVGEPAVT